MEKWRSYKKPKPHHFYILSWKGCAQFGFKLKRPHVGELPEKLTFPSASEHRTMSVDVRLISTA